MKKEIELTVGLPMYRSEHIGWLALESLCRQKDINFKWELLIMEEEEGGLGIEKVKSFSSRLQAVGCERIEYYGHQKWVPLSRKWKRLADCSSNESICFLLQAADCYSQPYRLAETYKIFKEDEEVDWSQAPQGYFYDIGAESLTLFNSQYPQWKHPCALNMAMKTSLLRQIKYHDVRRGVDHFLFKQLTHLKGSRLRVKNNLSPHWKQGVDTHGLNNISVKRGEMLAESKPPFFPSDDAIEDLLPMGIILTLKECRSFVKGNRYLS